MGGAAWNSLDVLLGRSTFEEQAMGVVSELYLYLPSNNTSLVYFILNKNCGCLSHRKKHKNTLLGFGCSDGGQACVGKRFNVKE